MQILREVCRDRHRTFADSKIVPFKDRCGVTDLNNIVEDNMCLCSEQNDNGVDFSVWTLGQGWRELQLFMSLPCPKCESYRNMYSAVQINLPKGLMN